MRTENLNFEVIFDLGEVLGPHGEDAVNFQKTKGGLTVSFPFDTSSREIVIHFNRVFRVVYSAIPLISTNMGPNILGGSDYNKILKVEDSRELEDIKRKHSYMSDLSQYCFYVHSMETKMWVLAKEISVEVI